MLYAVKECQIWDIIFCVPRVKNMKYKFWKSYVILQYRSQFYNIVYKKEGNDYIC